MSYKMLIVMWVLLKICGLWFVYFFILYISLTNLDLVNGKTLEKVAKRIQHCFRNAGLEDL
jgi:hypothetical protein